jgi:sulfur carrier protein
VKVRLRNPTRDVDMRGAVTVNRLLDDLELNRESHLVIRNGTLVPGDALLDEADAIEVRPVISGGFDAPETR